MLFDHTPGLFGQRFQLDHPRLDRQQQLIESLPLLFVEKTHVDPGGEAPGERKVEFVEGGVRLVETAPTGSAPGGPPADRVAQMRSSVTT